MQIPSALPYPTQFQVASYSCGPWHIAASTRIGTGHTAKGVPTDDAMIVTRCGPHILLAVADGAGDARASRSAEGAQRAVATAAAAAQRNWGVYGPDKQLLIEAMAAAHVDLVSRAQAERQPADVFASTLMLVLLAGERIVAARIGDGSLYTWDGKQLTRFCSAPLPAVQTPMLVQPDWRDWVATADQERSSVMGLAMCSDGGDDFFLEDAKSGGPRQPSETMFRSAADFTTKYGPTGLMGFVMQMLNDREWARRTSDDRTLIMALKA